jgi:hypothetical protein
MRANMVVIFNGKLHTSEKCFFRIGVIIPEIPFDDLVYGFCR